MDGTDRSNGYESVAEVYIAGRGAGGIIGRNSVRQWAQQLPAGGSVLDLGCGPGAPISQVLIDCGLVVYGVDASARMIAAFRARFPAAPAECNTVEDSLFFSRAFDGVVAWGLMFLLAPAVQALLIRKVASALDRGGRFLFTSPEQDCEWLDAMTGRNSISLGARLYAEILRAEGLDLVGQSRDEGENYYYLAIKR
jgi:SAM-dependent methyltransferase